MTLDPESTEYRVLRAMIDLPEAEARPSTIAAILGIPADEVYDAIETLTERGFVERARGDEN